MNETIQTMNRLGGSGEPFLFLLDFELQSPEVLTPPEAEAKGILYAIGGASNAPAPHPHGGPLRFGMDPVSETEYRRAFDMVQDELAAGNTYLLNLTFPTLLAPEGNRNGGSGDFLRSAFLAGPALYRLYYPGRFVCFSPESFVRIEGDVIASRPMKGTIPAEVPGAREILLADAKELAEHTTIVDLIRNDLNTVASDVTVERFRYVDRVATSGGDLLQVSSLITGRLGAGWRRRLGETIAGLLPAGSVTGAPKRKTVEIIRRAEGRPRGFYTGIAGYFDGTNLDSCVLIRFIEEQEGKYSYRSGGGITTRSDPDAEYREMIRKVYVPAF